MWRGPRADESKSAASQRIMTLTNLLPLMEDRLAMNWIVDLFFMLYKLRVLIENKSSLHEHAREWSFGYTTLAASSSTWLP